MWTDLPVASVVAGQYQKDRDDVPDQRELFWFVKTFSRDGDRDLGPSRTSQPFHAIHQGEIFCRISVDLNDLIPGQDPGLKGRGVFDGRDHGEDAILDGNLNSQSFKPTLRLLLHFFIHIRGHESRVGI